MIRLIAIAALLGLAGLMLYIRLVPSDPEAWHVDPSAAPKPDKPNHWLVRTVSGDAEPPQFALPATELAAIVDAVAMAQPRVERLAGSAEAGHITYVARTLWMGFPDFISIRVHATGGGSSLVAFSRSRFGYSDMGVNRARLEAWLAAIDAAVRERESQDG